METMSNNNKLLMMMAAALAIATIIPALLIS